MTHSSRIFKSQVEQKGNPILWERWVSGEFLSVAQVGNIALLKTLLEAKIHSDKAKTPQDEIALFIAVGTGDHETVKILIDAKADPTISRKEDNATPLHFAANCKIANTLIDAKAKLEATTITGATPLIAATQRGNIETMSVLIKAKAELEATNQLGETPLLTSLRSKNAHEMVNLLIKAKANPNTAKVMENENKQKEILSPLTQAVLVRNTNAVDALVNAKAALHPDDVFTPLNVAIQNGDVGIVKILLDAKTDPLRSCPDGHDAFLTAMYTAIFNKQFNTEIVSALIDAKANVNKVSQTGITMLHNAVIYGEDKLVKKLIDAKAKVNNAMTNGETALSLAVQNGNLGMVNALLDAKANPNPQTQAYGFGSIFDLPIKGYYGKSALFAAVNKGRCDIVSALLEANANPDIWNEKGETPLNIAMKKSDEDVAMREMAIILTTSASKRKLR